MVWSCHSKWGAFSVLVRLVSGRDLRVQSCLGHIFSWCVCDVKYVLSSTSGGPCCLTNQFWSLLGVLLSLYFYCICINALSASMSGPFWRRALEKGIRSIGTGFSVLVSYHVGAQNWTQLLCRNIMWFNHWATSPVPSHAFLLSFCSYLGFVFFCCCCSDMTVIIIDKIKCNTCSLASKTCVSPLSWWAGFFKTALLLLF